MKRVALLVSILLLALSVKASPVSRQEASTLAAAFLKQAEVKAVSTAFEHLYIFNGDHGFVILAADDGVIPVLGYSLDEVFSLDMAENTREWLQRYDEAIHEVMKTGVDDNEEIKEAWLSLKKEGCLPVYNRNVVKPLVLTRWHQNSPYNMYCPLGSCPVGDVATAMAQLMKYWEYPRTGIGQHAYQLPYYGWQNANFGSTVYDWDNMPIAAGDDSPPAVRQAVATLNYHCGVSVEMEYGPNDSQAYTDDVPGALATYFGYNPSMMLVSKADYSNFEWKNLLKREFDASRPVYYDGYGNAGFAFICDGYDASNYFHFNWGWGGSNDGYYAIGALNPYIYNLNEDNGAIIGIQPSETLIYAPSELNAVVQEGHVRLSWIMPQGAVSCNVYRDNELVATGITESTYCDTTTTYGIYEYYLKAVDSNGNRSLRSDPVEVKVIHSPSNMQRVFLDESLTLTWEMPFGDDLHYGDDSGLNGNWYGYNGQYDTYWGQRYPVELLRDYVGLSMRSVSVYSKEGTYTLYILNGEFNNDWELILRKECAFDELGWNEVVFDNPVDLDCTRDLWVVFSAPSTNHYPAYFRDYNGPGVEDAAYIGGTMDYFYQMSGISWLIKVNLTDSNFTYRLEKNGMQLATGLTTRTFMDDDLSSGTFNYQVWCSFGGVECDESASCSISLGRVEVSTSDLEAGTVQGGGLAEVGSQMTVTATPNDGYVFRGWVIDGEVVSDDEEYSFTVSGDISLQAVFAYTYNYNISATVEPSEGGSVSGTGLYVEGESCTLVAEPHENYVFIAWKEGGTEISTDDHYTFTVEGPRDFVAVFAKKYLTIQASAGLGGTITPRGTVTVERGEDVTFTMSPNTGCSVLQVSVDDDEVGDVQSYTFTNVTENHTIHVQFKGYGVDEDVAEVRIIPNPVKDQLHVESPTIIYQYEIITVNGVMVERKTVCNSCMDCRLEGFAEGVYFLRLFTDEGVITKKIIVSE